MGARCEARAAGPGLSVATVSNTQMQIESSADGANWQPWQTAVATNTLTTIPDTNPARVRLFRAILLVP